MRVVGYKFIVVRAKNKDEAESKASNSGLDQWTDLNEENADIVGAYEVPSNPSKYRSMKSIVDELFSDS